MEIRDPIILIHADVTSGKTFWHTPQLDRALRGKIGSAKGKSIKVQIPTAQALPETAPELLSGLEAIYLTTGIRKTAASTTRSFLESFAHQPDQEKLYRDFQEKNAVLKLEKIKELCLNRQFSEARIRIKSLQSDPDTAVTARFFAQVQLRGIDHTECLFAGKPQIELARIQLAHARELQRLARPGPTYLKFAALIEKQSAELRMLTHEDAGLFMAIRQHLERGGNPFVALSLYAQRSANTRTIILKYNQCIRLAQYASNYKGRWMLAPALGSIVHAVSIYLITLRYEARHREEDALAQSSLQICKLAARIANEAGDAESVILSIMNALSTTHSTESEAYRWANDVADNIRDEKDSREARAEIDRITRRWRGESVEGDYHGDTIWQIIQNISTAHGIDIGDESNPLVQGLRIAAKDNNPGRVLANCEHLLVSAGGVGPRARLIQEIYNIGTACSKVVHCTLHNFHVEDKEMDTAYDRFKRTHCDSCRDRKPRPAGWRCTDQIKREIEDQNLEFVKPLAGTEFGIRFTAED